MVATSRISYCSDRSAAYEIEKILLGGSPLARNLYQYGTPDPRESEESKGRLFPRPFAGLEAAKPKYGWSFVQIPGKSKTFIHTVWRSQNACLSYL